MKIIFTTDFLTHSLFYPCTYHDEVLTVINSVQKCATGLDIIELRNYSVNNEVFNRDKFFELSGIKDVSIGYYPYDINAINDRSWEYFFSFIDNDTFIFGFELGLDLRKVLTQKGVKYINFWIHSFKLFDDSIFMINTNDPEIFQKLEHYKVPYEYFKLYADYWKANIIREALCNNVVYDAGIEDNSVLFIGQTFLDVSVKKDNGYLNILNFKDRLHELSKKYSKIYYSPHPLVSCSPEVDEYINSVDYIEKISDIPTYYLLASNKIKKVISVSSSVIYEAQYFDKDTEYLFQPLFNIDGEFGLNTFISVMSDYFNPKFWTDILSPVMPTNSNVIDKILFTNIKNKMRNTINVYYGYMYLDEVKRTENKLKDLMKKELSEILDNINLSLERSVDELRQTDVSLASRVKELESQSSRFALYRRVVKNNTSTRYIFGIPVYRRKGTKKYILGILVSNKEKK